MSVDYTQKVMDAVERARRSIRSAESTFDIEGRRIQRKAAYTTIDVYNMSKAVEILADVKRTTDTLYSCYESTIRHLDDECRPYLSFGIRAYAIKEVADLMREINKESSGLSSNATGTLNGYSMGDLRTEYYMASIQARNIENFWTNQYDATPEAEQQAKRKAQALAERRKKQEEQAKLEAERRKKEAEEKKRQAEIKAAEEKKTEKANISAKLYMDNFEADCNTKICEFEKSLEIYIEKTENRYKEEINKKVEELKITVEQLKEKRLQLSIFKSSEKKELKDEISKIEARILKFQNPLVITTEINLMRAKSRTAVENYQQKIEEYLDKRFSDYNSSEEISKKRLMFTENPEIAKTPIPLPPKPEDVF